MRITQYCPKCRELVRAKYETRHEGGMLVFDVSWCEWCETTLWCWSYQPPVLGEAYKEPKKQEIQMSLW
jgi:hypothetical protein